jgi:hypothetical protein
VKDLSTLDAAGLDTSWNLTKIAADYLHHRPVYQQQSREMQVSQEDFLKDIILTRRE